MATVTATSCATFNPLYDDLVAAVARVAEPIFGRPVGEEVDDENFMMAALATHESRREARRIQAQQIKLGTFVERLIDAVARTRGDIHLPARLYGPGVTPKTHLGKPKQKTFVASCLPSKQVDALAAAVARDFLKLPAAKHTKGRLMRSIGAAQEKLAQVPSSKHDAEPTLYYVDNALQWRENGAPVVLALAETKTSGRLDSKNAKDELRQLLRPVLALGPYPCPVLPVAAMPFEARTNTLRNIFPSGLLWEGADLWGAHPAPRALLRRPQVRVPGRPGGLSLKTSSGSMG